MASASCLTTVCSPGAARSGSSRAAWRIEDLEPALVGVVGVVGA